jgi:hypothetical protein
LIVSRIDEKRGEIVLSQSQEQMVPVQVVEKVKQGNQEVAVARMTMKSVSVQSSLLYALKEITFSNAKGEKVARDKALAQLKPGMVIVAAGSEGKVAPEYLKLLKPEVVIVNLPGGVGPGAGGGVGAFGGVGVQIAPAPVAPPALVPRNKN